MGSIGKSSSLKSTYSIGFPLGIGWTGVYRFAFNGYEKNTLNNEDINSYTTELRQFDYRLGRWFSPDPYKQFFTSQYSAFKNNPIFYIDPNGGWVPVVEYKKGEKGEVVDGYLALKKEKGDNAKSLSSSLGISNKEAKELLKQISKNGTIKVPDKIAGPINSAIRDDIRNPGNYADNDSWSQKFFAKILFDPNYNCHSSSWDISKGRAPRKKSNDELNEKIMDELKTNYANVGNDAGKYLFGRTIATFDVDIWEMRFDHSATYIGTSQNGTMYFWTKNGYFNSPTIMTLKEIEDIYGLNENFKGENGKGFFNHK